LKAEIATLRERNVELLAQAEKKSQSGEQQLQAQQAHMQMQLIQQAQVETEKFGKAVEQMVHSIICTEKVIYKFLHYKLSRS
jgi:DNA-binding protein H-NS